MRLTPLLLLLTVCSAPLVAQARMLDGVGCDSAAVAQANRRHPEHAEARKADCRAERWPGLRVDATTAVALGCDVLDSVMVYVRPLSEANEWGTVEHLPQAIPEPGWDSCVVLALWGLPANEQLVRVGNERSKTWTYRRWNRLHVVMLREAKDETRTAWIVTAVSW